MARNNAIYSAVRLALCSFMFLPLTILIQISYKLDQGLASMTGTKKILLLCVHSAAQPQMAEGFLNACSSNRYEAHSAGNERTEMHPRAIEVMAELGVDISKQLRNHQTCLLKLSALPRPARCVRAAFSSAPPALSRSVPRTRLLFCRLR